jgi:hypothetical protein
MSGIGEKYLNGNGGEARAAHGPGCFYNVY